MLDADAKTPGCLTDWDKQALYTMLSIQKEQEKKALEAQAAEQKLKVELRGPPEPRNYEEMAKQPATWVHHFAPMATILHAPW